MHKEPVIPVPDIRANAKTPISQSYMKEMISGECSAAQYGVLTVSILYVNESILTGNKQQVMNMDSLFRILIAIYP